LAALGLKRAARVARMIDVASLVFQVELSHSHICGFTSCRSVLACGRVEIDRNSRAGRKKGIERTVDRRSDVVEYGPVIIILLSNENLKLKIEGTSTIRARPKTTHPYSAHSNALTASRQRGRWIKGYLVARGAA